MPFKPKLFESMKAYSKKKFINDVIAGLTVASVALPLSIAISVASAAGPEAGLISSIIAGFLVALCGGSNVNISGPTAALITVVYGIVITNGIEGLIISTLMAGAMLILMGLLRLGSLVKYIPMTITTGFFAGLSISVIIGQIKHFLGLKLEGAPIEGIDKLHTIFETISTFNYQAFIVGIISLAILIFLPRFTKVVPPTIVVILVGSLAVWAFRMNVNTVGDLYEFSPSFPAPSLPNITLHDMISLMPEAFTIAILVAIESMLSSVISDGIINDKTNSNTELIALGLGNIATGFFGGIPATAAIGRTAINIKSGGRSSISGMVHSITILLAMLLFQPLVYAIPMPVIASILFVVAFNMADWKRFIHICKTATHAETLILIVTFILTVAVNLVTAISAGFILMAFLFLKEMADSANVRPWTGAGSKIIPDGAAIYELNGPMFFAATDKLLDIDSEEMGISAIILRASNMTLLDIEAIRNLEKMVEQCNKNNVTIIICNIKDQPLRAMQKVGLIGKIGHDNFCNTIDEAIERSEIIITEIKEKEALEREKEEKEKQESEERRKNEKASKKQ